MAKQDGDMKRNISLDLTLKLPKSRQQNFRLQIFSKNVKSMPYHNENSKTREHTV